MAREFEIFQSCQVAEKINMTNMKNMEKLWNFEKIGGKIGKLEKGR